MKFLSTLVACWGANEHGSSATLMSFVSKNNDNKNLLVGLVQEKKLVGSGKKGGKSVQQPVQWRPSLCTISEDDVVMVERIQLYVKPGKQSRKNTALSTPKYTLAPVNLQNFVGVES